MELNRVHHIAIIGSDYEISKHFYVDILGFQVIREHYREDREDYKIDLQLGDMELELFIRKDCPKRPKMCIRDSVMSDLHGNYERVLCGKG